MSHKVTIGAFQQLAHGFTDRMLSRLVHAGLITIQYEVIQVDAKLIEVSKVIITEAGRLALEPPSPMRYFGVAARVVARRREALGGLARRDQLAINQFSRPHLRPQM